MDSAEKFLRYIASVRRYSPRTCAIYRDVLQRFIGYSSPSDTDAADTGSDGRAAAPTFLSPDSIRNYEVHLMDREGLDARTVNLHLSVLSSWCRFLIREGELKTNPVLVIKRPRQDKRLPEFYRDESIRKYFDSHRGTMQYAPYEQQLN